jgi:hypothetical protein
MSPDDAETHNAALSTGGTAPGVSALGTSVAVHSLTATSRLGRGVRAVVDTASQRNLDKHRPADTFTDLGTTRSGALRPVLPANPGEMKCHARDRPRHRHPGRRVPGGLVSTIAAHARPPLPPTW